MLHCHEKVRQVYTDTNYGHECNAVSFRAVHRNQGQEGQSYGQKLDEDPVEEGGLEV